MNIVGLLLAAGAVLVVVAFWVRRQRNQAELRQMEEDEEIRSQLGYTQLEEFEAMHDGEAWRGDQYPEDEDDPY